MDVRAASRILCRRRFLGEGPQEAPLLASRVRKDPAARDGGQRLPVAGVEVQVQQCVIDSHHRIRRPMLEHRDEVVGDGLSRQTVDTHAVDKLLDDPVGIAPSPLAHVEEREHRQEAHVGVF
ncbi:hypothetical protein ACFPRL_29255 [Pseudoclavibacter helvolus]